MSLLLAAALASALAAPPGPAIAARSVRSCILLSSGTDTQYYPADDHTIAIRYGGKWFKLVVTPSSRLTAPDSFFINEIRGTSTLCSPLDFELSVAEKGLGGFREPLIAQSFEEIPRAEGEALRKQSRR